MHRGQQNTLRYKHASMIEENRQLVPAEPVEFEGGTGS